MSLTAPRIELVGSGRRDAVAAMLARAFADDPAMAWIVPDPRVRARALPRLFRILFDGDAKIGFRLATLGDEAATLWRGPGHAVSGTGEMLRVAVPLIAALGRSLPRALAVSAAIDANMPREPFWYLHIAGCDPAHQGNGLGRAVVQAGIDRFAPSGLPLYLETATGRNLGFYQALGFRVTSEWRVRGDGPRFWSMLRRG